MQTRNLPLTLPENEWAELCKDAGRSLRTPKQHARFLLRRALGIDETQDQPQAQSVPSNQEAALA